MRAYGKELLLDLHHCDTSLFNRGSLRRFLKDLCKHVDMKPAKLVWWDDLNTPPEEKQTEPHLVGTSAVQFILTSTIVIHTLDLLGSVYINLFSCKDFDAKEATQFISMYFSTKDFTYTVVERTSA